MTTSIDDYLQVMCVPRRIKVMNDKISEDLQAPRRKLLKESCFEGLYKIHTTIVGSELVAYLTTKWDRENKGFIFADGKKFIFRDRDVHRVYGIPCGVNLKPISLDMPDGDLLPEFRLLRRFGLGQNQNNMIKERDLRALLEKPEMELPENALMVWKFYVLYALQSLLLATSTNAISGRYLYYLRDDATARKYNWCNLIITRLTEYLNNAQGRTSRFPRSSGDFHCLVYMITDYLVGASYLGCAHTCSIKRDFRLIDLRSSFEKVEQPIPPFYENETEEEIEALESLVILYEEERAF